MTIDYKYRIAQVKGGFELQRCLKGIGIEYWEKVQKFASLSEAEEYYNENIKNIIVKYLD